MYRYLAVLVGAIVLNAEERPLPNPEVVKWQAEAQARERAINRRMECQLEKAQVAGKRDAEKPKSPRKPVIAVANVSRRKVER